MNILFMTIAYPKAGEYNIYSDLMDEFEHNGHQVYVACSSEKRHSQQTALTRDGGKSILRIRVGNLTGNVNIIEKGLATVLLERTFIEAINSYYKTVKFDLILYSTPPITFAKAIEYFKKRDGAKTYLLLKDIFPQNAVDIGLIKGKSLIEKYFRYKEEKLYRISDYIGCMSKANVDYILSKNHYILPGKVEVCPNSVKLRSVELDDHAKKGIRQKYNIPFDKTIFVYGGNLGKPQGIDFLSACLKANKGNKAIYFLIVGSGSEFSKLQAIMDAEQFTNACLLSQLPKDDYEKLMNACDVGLVFLDKHFTIPNFPSRILSYMQACMPVLAATDRNTDIGQVIESGKFGFWCESNDVSAFNANMRQFYNAKLRKQMGANAREYLEKNYNVKYSYEIIMKHFQ